MKLFLALSAVALIAVGCTARNPAVEGPYFMQHDDHDKICYTRGTDVICDYHEHNKPEAPAPHHHQSVKKHDQYHDHNHSHEG